MTPSTSQNSSTKVEYKCQACQDKGFALLDDRTARVCACQEQARIERLFKSSRITPAFQDKTFASFETDKCNPMVRKMRDVAKSYSDQFKEIDRENNWLVFLGQPGSGKSHLTLAVANELIRQSIPVLYFQHVEGFKEMVGMIRRNEDIQPKIEEMKTVAVLLWDDFWKPVRDKRNPSAFEIETSFEIINYRYLNLLPTIINSERTPKELVTIDEATGSRIIERGKGRLVVVEGIENNWRLKS